MLETLDDQDFDLLIAAVGATLLQLAVTPGPEGPSVIAYRALLHRLRISTKIILSISE